jgi:hypothetical protein
MAWKKKRNRLPPFVPSTSKMLNHQAYIDLPSLAAKALPYFFGKVKVPYNSPEYYLQVFPFSYNEGKRLGWWIRRHADRIVDGRRFVRASGNRSAEAWRVAVVESVSPVSSVSLTLDGKSVSVTSAR